MAMPVEILDPAISLIATYRATNVPAEHNDKLLLLRELDDDPTCIFWG